MTDRPSSPRLVVRVGVTGHREGPDLGSDALADAIRTALDEIQLIAREVLQQNSALFDSTQTEPDLRIVSSLAKGADRLVAREAHRRGYVLHSPLPFLREDYLRNPALGSREEFEQLLDQAETVFELDNSSATDAQKEEAYLASGRLVLRQSDILIAVWDGEPARGPGGTGQIAQEALDAEIPTLWIESTSPHKCILRLSRRDFSARGSQKDLAKRLRERLRQILLPQSGAPEMDAASEASHFFSKRPSRKWQKAPELPPGLHHAGDDILRIAFEWADNHANGYARIYRYSYRMIYSLGALAVFFAYLGSTADELPKPFPGNHYVFLILEITVIAAIILLAFRGRKLRWHEHWLDYRHLAESLRMMRLLALMGRVISHFQVPPHVGKGDSSKSWTHFYLRALVQQTGLAAVRMDASYREEFRVLLYEFVVNQEKYHRNKVSRCDLTHKLWHGLAQVLFGFAAIACVLHFLVHGTNSNPWVLTLNLMVIVLPAVGGAIGAILYHGESERIARRSKALGERLKELKAELLAQRGHALTAQELGRLAEDFSNICLAELMDWRFLFLDRPLGLPA